jgi:hypothetical protein
MAATEPSSVLEPTTSTAPAALAPLAPAVPEADAEQATIERTVAHSAIAGMIIGSVVCAGVWVVLMMIALVGKGSELGPMLLAAAGCGIFAGMFLGGWVGTLIGASKLEHHEHATLPGASGHH